MKSKLILAILILALSHTGFTQALKTNLFVRIPHVVNYNMHQGEINYASVISIGAGLLYNTKFIELATFINDDDVYGFYTFFGKTLKSKNLGTNWDLNTNWFGEVTYVPRQSSVSDSFTYTSGLCFFLNYSFDWGSIGLPFCIGTAYSQQTISINTRTILNVSLLMN